jgi:hypothetical protein
MTRDKQISHYLRKKTFIYQFGEKIGKYVLTNQYLDILFSNFYLIHHPQIKLSNKTKRGQSCSEVREAIIHQLCGDPIIQAATESTRSSHNKQGQVHVI